MLEVDRTKAALCSVDATTGEAARERLCQVVKAAAEADLVVAFRVTRVEGRDHYDGLVACGDPDLRERCVALDGQPMQRLPWSAERPRPREINRMSDPYASLDARQLEQTPVVRDIYLPMGVLSQPRVLAFQGRAFVGFFGLMFRRPVAADELATLSRLTSSLVAGMQAAEALDAPTPEAMFLLTRPDGAPLHVTPAARRWIGAAALERIAAHVRRLDRGDAAGLPTQGAVAGLVYRIVRMTGDGLTRYLVTFEAAAPITQAPDALLTPRQREIARHAVAGATVPEIARASGLSRETVKSHLKQIYRRLEVGSRVELAERLAG